MKHVQLFAIVAAALCLGACAGSGGSSGPAPALGVSTTPRIEAVLTNPTTYDSGTDANGNPYSYIYQDPENIEAQDTVQFELVNYTTTNGVVTRNVLNTNNWQSSDILGTYGQIAYSSGNFVAGNNETVNPLIVSTTYQGQTYSAFYRVEPRQVRLRGQVVADGTLTQGVYGIEIDFYGPQNPSDPTSPQVLLGRVQTSYNGTFRASIPESVNQFQINNASIPAGYQRYYRYSGGVYRTGDAGCRAPVPPFTNGERFLIDYTNPDDTANGTINLLTASEPTPDPSTLACTGG